MATPTVEARDQANPAQDLSKAPWNQPRIAATMTIATMSTSTQFMDSKLDRSFFGSGPRRWPVQYHQLSDNGRHDLKETMIRVPALARSLVRVTALCSAAGIVLASCGTTPVIVTPVVTGLPAISISVPLSNVACTTDNTCVAIGTSNLERESDLGWRVPNRDRAMDVDHGAQRRHVDVRTGLVVLERWLPLRRITVERRSRVAIRRRRPRRSALSRRQRERPASRRSVVMRAMTCAVLDNAKSGSRILFTNDGGTSWSAPLAVGVPSQDSAIVACLHERESLHRELSECVQRNRRGRVP